MKTRAYLVTATRPVIENGIHNGYQEREFFVDAADDADADFQAMMLTANDETTYTRYIGPAYNQAS